MKLIAFVFSALLIVSCSGEMNNMSSSLMTAPQSNIAELVELSDEDYPDNPDVLVRHVKYTSSYMKSIEFVPNGNNFNIVVVPSEQGDDTVHLNNIALMEFIPTIPNSVKDDSYMSLISVVNQEWNRNQVKWENEDLQKILPKDFRVNGELITRVDLARNCLKSYLWELFFYAEEDGKNKVFYHAWFDFPKELYHQLFEERNGVPFENYAKYLEQWVDPPSEKLKLANIRLVEKRAEMTQFCASHNNEMYPLKGERLKKNIEIIYPVSYSKMSDFHTDSTLFATFSNPGFYNRADPRTTELGRFYELKKVEYRATSYGADIRDEVSMSFARKNGELTEFVFGGLDFKTLPKLSVEQANSGNQYSMGIANHPFYEDVQSHEALSSRDNYYFGVLLDAEGKWLDSHAIGIDGPLLHLDADNPNILHIWLLSFERHALVGHYTLNLGK